VSTRVGIGLSRDSVRAVVVRGSTITWHGEEALDANAPDSLARLLARIPARVRKGTRVRAAVGPAGCQVKRLEGLPPKAKPRVVTQAVAAGVERFFLRNGVPLVTSDAERRGDAWWGAAFEAPVVDILNQACAARGLSLVACVPAAAILSRALDATAITWRDADVEAHVQVRNGAWADVRRSRAVEHAIANSPRAVRPLAKLGADAIRYADAYAAAICGKGASLALRPRLPGKVEWRAVRVRAVLIGVAVVFAALAAVAPGIAAWRAGRIAAGRLDSLRDQAAQVARANFELQRATIAESEVSRFANSRRSLTYLLGALTAALPESTAMVSFRADTSGGTLILLSPAGAGVLTSLDSVRSIQDPRVIGSISRESVNGAALQRVAVRFRFPGSAPRRVPARSPGARGARP
jgi:hypothetical protein